MDICCSLTQYQLTLLVPQFSFGELALSQCMWSCWDCQSKCPAPLWLGFQTSIYTTGPPSCVPLNLSLRPHWTFHWISRKLWLLLSKLAVIAPWPKLRANHTLSPVILSRVTAVQKPESLWLTTQWISGTAWVPVFSMACLSSFAADSLRDLISFQYTPFPVVNQS